MNTAVDGFMPQCSWIPACAGTTSDANAGAFPTRHAGLDPASTCRLHRSR
jgi:hypothetical protein